MLVSFLEHVGKSKTLKKPLLQRMIVCTGLVLIAITVCGYCHESVLVTVYSPTVLL